MKYGIIGNCKTAALVHQSGGIDWCCLPRFDSPSVFAALLDPEGGSFRIEPIGDYETRQSYLPETNILKTEFFNGPDAFAVIDFMPRYREDGLIRRPVEIHRLLKPLKGRPSVKISFDPRLNYARNSTSLELRPQEILAHNELETVALYSSLPPTDLLEHKPILLEKEEFLILTYHEKIHPPSLEYSREMFEKTKVYWEHWSGRCRLPKLFSETVLRSALTLKLLTYDDTGAIVAAPTTSLPEISGDVRNWDYRYCWLRDASLMLEALKGIGHFEEAREYFHFLLRLFESKQMKVQIVYRIDGRRHLDEEILPHLKGYQNSKPVRIGNEAWTTQQNDIFGEIVNGLFLYYLHYRFEEMTDEIWSLVKFLVETTIREWASPDAGIWEYRHQKAHFTFSKILSWVALDRGVRFADKLGKNHTMTKWKNIAETIHRNIEENAWDSNLGAYTQIYGSKSFDASLLLMSRYGFIRPEDPRWISTVRQFEKQLMREGFVFRYTSPDDFGIPRSAFIVASLWMAQALNSIGEREKALSLFEKVLSHANHLGLLSEVINPETGELLGNFPQAYSHMAVINTARLLSQEPGETGF